MTELLEQIRTRGYWEIVIHPTEFDPALVPNILELESIIKSLCVTIHGWSFPHIGSGPVTIGRDYIESKVDWSDHREFWRFYQSGQFVFVGSLFTDWWDQSAVSHAPGDWVPGTLLEVQTTFYRYVEVFEFASRLAAGRLQPASLRVSIALNGLKDRRLSFASWYRVRFSFDRIASIPSIDHAWLCPREQLMADSRGLAREGARELFRRFAWDTDDTILEGLLSEVRRAGFTV